MVVQAVLHQQKEEALMALFSHHLSKAKEEGNYSLTEEHWAACLELSPARSNSIS